MKKKKNFVTICFILLSFFVLNLCLPTLSMTVQFQRTSSCCACDPANASSSASPGAVDCDSINCPCFFCAPFSIINDKTKLFFGKSKNLHRGDRQNRALVEYGISIEYPPERG